MKGQGARFYPAGQVNLEGVAHLLTSGKAKNVVVLAGAGISTSAGIPDFRSPDTGLYANLAKYQLPYPEAIFDVDYFRERPEAFYTLARELYPGQFRPTPTHHFVRLLDQRGLLLRCFTQNIDTLERLAGLPEDKVIEAHGSFASAACISCRAPADPAWLKERIDRMEVPRCRRKGCKGGDGTGGLVKPDITFFGEGLPARFFQHIGDLGKADLLIVIGTSLKVHPFASLVDRVPNNCPRVLINLELVGELAAIGGGSLGGMHPGGMNEGGFDFRGATCGGPEFTRDVYVGEESDKAVRELTRLCGWEADLDKLITKRNSELDVEWAPAQTEAQEKSSTVPANPGTATAAASSSAASGSAYGHVPRPSVAGVLEPRLMPLAQRASSSTAVATARPDRDYKAVLMLPLTASSTPASLVAHLRETFNAELERGLTYPQHGPMNEDEFKGYFIGHDLLVGILLSAGDVHLTRVLEAHSETPLPAEGVPYTTGGSTLELVAEIEKATKGDWELRVAGFYYIKPNYPGRASHICNAGFVVPPRNRGLGLGVVLGQSFLHYAPAIGYRSSVFNLVFENNEASLRIWDRLGFHRVGRIPRAGLLRKPPRGKDASSPSAAAALDAANASQADEEEEYVDAIVIFKDFTALDTWGREAAKEEADKVASQVVEMATVPEGRTKTADGDITAVSDLTRAVQGLEVQNLASGKSVL